MVPGSHRILLLSPVNVGGKRAQMLPRLLASKTSNQILVLIFPDWPPDLVLDDYAQELFHAAKIGQQGKGQRCPGAFIAQGRKDQDLDSKSVQT